MELFLDGAPFFEKAETVLGANTAGDDIGLDSGTREALETVFELLVIASARVSVGAYQIVIGCEANISVWFPALVDCGNELAHGINQNVLVPDGRNSAWPWLDRNGVAVVFVGADLGIWLLRQAEHGMFHAVPIVFECPIENIGDEKIPVGMTVRCEFARFLSLRGPRLLE